MIIVNLEVAIVAIVVSAIVYLFGKNAFITFMHSVKRIAIYFAYRSAGMCTKEGVPKGDYAISLKAKKARNLATEVEIPKSIQPSPIRNENKKLNKPLEAGLETAAYIRAGKRVKVVGNQFKVVSA